MSIETIKKILFERIEKQRRPEFFPFNKPGDYVIGKVVYTYQSNFGDPSRDTVDITVIRALDPEEYRDKLYSLPHNAMLISGLKRENVEPDDYVMIVYDGESQTKRKFPVKIFLVAKVAEEELAQLEESKEKKPKIEEVKAPKVEAKIPQKVEAKPVEQEAKPEEKKIEVKTKIDDQTIASAISLTKDLLEFYEEIPIQQLEESLRSAGIDVPINIILEKCSFIQVDGNIIKPKK